MKLIGFQSIFFECQNTGKSTLLAQFDWREWGGGGGGSQGANLMRFLESQAMVSDYLQQLLHS